MRERDDEILQKEQARHMMLAPLRGQQLKNYVTGIRNQLNAERLFEKKRAYNEAITKYAFLYFCIISVLVIVYWIGVTVDAGVACVLALPAIEWQKLTRCVSFAARTERENRKRSCTRRASRPWPAMKRTEHDLECTDARYAGVCGWLCC